MFWKDKFQQLKEKQFLSGLTLVELLVSLQNAGVVFISTNPANFTNCPPTGATSDPSVLYSGGVYATTSGTNIPINFTQTGICFNAALYSNILPQEGHFIIGTDRDNTFYVPYYIFGKNDGWLFDSSFWDINY